MAIARRHPYITLVLALFVLVCGTVSLGMLRRAEWTEILKVYEASLTTFLPSTPTLKQDVRPQVLQRGVGLDGTRRGGAALPIALNGNPFESGWSGGEAAQGAIDLQLGYYEVHDVDLALPAILPWRIGRTYNPRQLDSGSSHHDSNGFAGYNWFQDSQPELLFYDDGTSDDNDMLVLVYGAERYVEFRRVDIGGSTANAFKAVNGAAGVIQVNEDFNAPDTYTYTDQHGNEIVFFGFDEDNVGTGEVGSDPANGQIWKMTDPAGNVAYVGDPSDPEDAIANGFTGDGYIEYAYDSADRRFTYTYSTLDSVVRLTQVKAETKSGGTWASPTGVVEVGKVAYSYYTTSEDHGLPGDLKLVTKTTPLTDSGQSLVEKTYYRYWKDGYDAGSNPGYDHQLKLVLGPEGTRNYDYSVDQDVTDDDFIGEDDATLLPYAMVSLEYDSSRQVREAMFNGSCGCGGGSGTGTYSYAYQPNGSFSNTSGYQTAWKTRTIVANPDGSYETQYFDEVGQPISVALTDDDPTETSPVPKVWPTAIRRDSNGCLWQIYTPATITAYTHSTGAFAASNTVGLQWVYARESSGATTGFVEDIRYREGCNGSEYFQGAWTYATESVTPSLPGPVNADATVVRPFVATKVDYTQAVTSGGTGANTWTYTTSVHSGTLAVSTVATAAPAVTSGNNGSGSSVTTKTYRNEDGTLAFELSGLGYVTYREYTNGQLTKLIEDANTGLSTSGQDFENVTIPTGFDSSGSPTHWKSTWTYDPQGRRDTATEPSGRVEKWYYSNLVDERQVTIHYPKLNGSTFHGPADAVVMNQAGKPEARMTIAISGGSTATALTGHVDETDDDPITAMDLGSVASLSTSLYTEDGTVLEEMRTYHDIPGSGAGSDGANFDASLYGYDSRGRQTRMKAPHGTITRSVYDVRGNVTQRWMGTNDTSFPGGESSGTDDMVKLEELEFDGGNDKGNGHLTERTVLVDEVSGNNRVTSYAYDLKGNLLLETNPTAPHAFHKYDNMSRRIATGLYSGTGSIVLASEVPTVETDNRLALSETFFDERGQVWKTLRHSIASNGVSLDTLASEHWFDADGRSVKTDGSQLTKTSYDRLGRVTHSFVLASDNDGSTYANVLDVGGDIVLEENQTVYDGTSGDVVLSVRIDRFHSDVSTTTGVLDTNGDTYRTSLSIANLKGRAQIVGRWYDNLDRVTDEVNFGTYGNDDFAYPGSPPGRSVAVQRTTYTYGDDGRVTLIEDPRGKKTKREYDDAGRMVAEIRNYDSGVNSGNPSGSDDNVTVRYVFTNGMMTSLMADVPGSEDDQTTKYFYGTLNGEPAASEIATGHLLRGVIYPDSANGADEAADFDTDDADAVTFAYNRQGEQVEKKDQAGNIFATERDDSGRQTDLKWTWQVGGFDDAVQRISRSYDALGRPSLVTQHTEPTSGSVVDQVGYTYDGWGNVSVFAYDRDSAINAGGSDDEYLISYGWSKATAGRNTVRKTEATFPSGNVISYTYESSSSNDSNASRVTEVKDGATSLAAYQYLGAATVVGTTYDEPDVFYKLYESTNTYDLRMDRFNHTLRSTWTKDLASDVDFYSVSNGWDASGNVTTTVDFVHDGFDVKYRIDEIDRVTRAEEGTLTSGSIASRTRDQQWTLDHVGNWDANDLDLDGDGDLDDPGDREEVRTHNLVNELDAMAVYNDMSLVGNYALAYDEVGNLLDDGEEYEYVWDGFGRLRKILATSDQSLIAEYTYNGLGYLTGVHENTDGDTDTDNDDNWFYRMYDERWRWIGTFREDDTDPKEEFIPHQAGADGRGGSSYIDLVILRDRDGDNTEWTDAADGTMEERIYYCQNWRADVSAIVEDSGEMVEWVKYSVFGVPFGLRAGDASSDGSVDSNDYSIIQGWIDAPDYDILGDIDMDGDVDGADKSAAQGNESNMGRFKPSAKRSLRTLTGHTVISNWLLYARNRTFNTLLGRWQSRDPLEYVEDLTLYQFCRNSPTRFADAQGLSSSECIPGGCKYSVKKSWKKVGRYVACVRTYEKPKTACPEGCGCPEFTDDSGGYRADEVPRHVFELEWGTSSTLGGNARGKELAHQVKLLLENGEGTDAAKKAMENWALQKCGSNIGRAECRKDKNGAGPSGPATGGRGGGPDTPGPGNDGRRPEKNEPPITGEGRSPVPAEWWEGGKHG